MVLRLRALLRDTLAGGLDRTGLLDPARRSRDRLTIAMFHRVLPPEQLSAYPIAPIALTPDQLRFHLTELARDFECLPLRDAVPRWLASTRRSKPPLAVTFDDGQSDNFEFARPVLADLGLRATFFAVSDFVGQAAPLWPDALAFPLAHLLKHDTDRATRLLRNLGLPTPDGQERPTAILQVLEHAKRAAPVERDRLIEQVRHLAGGAHVPQWSRMMHADQLRALLAEGHEVGSHSASHPILPQCSPEAAEQEIRGSREALEQVLGGPVRSFCYPNGDVDRSTLARVAAAGYRYAVTTTWGTNRRGDDMLLLKRCNMDASRVLSTSGHLYGPTLRLRLSGLLPGLPS